MKVISMGWGVQSWTLAAMSALGELEKVDAVLHSDTTWERQATYEFAKQWTPWLEERGLRVVTVKYDYLIDGHVPVIDRWDNGPDIPAYHSYPDGRASGMMRRHCTGRWKIDVMRQWLRRELTRQKVPKTPGVIEQWLGITVDEIERAKDANVKWITHRFPLLEKRMTRQDCLAWLEKHSLPHPEKSSCVFCPYHTRKTWQEMKRSNGPDWQAAILIDESIRTKQDGYIAYVHRDRIPLIQIKIAAPPQLPQSGSKLLRSGK